MAAAGVILAALYLLWAYQRVFQHARRREPLLPEITWQEGLVMAPLVALIVFLGVYRSPCWSGWSRRSTA